MRQPAQVDERNDLTCASCGGKLNYIPAWAEDTPLCRACEEKRKNGNHLPVV